MSYDKKFRERVLAHVDAGKKEIEVSLMFGLGANTIKQWKKLREETGKLENRELKRKHKKIDPEKLRKDVCEKPEDFDEERAKRFNCTGEAIRQARKKHKLTRKKKQIGYEERDEEERTAYQNEIAEIPKEKRYYVDECGVNKYLYREYGYAPRGVKVLGKMRGKKFQRLNIIAAKCEEDIVARYEYTCSMNAKLFELWFVEALLKEIPAGSVIIMDKAPFHRRKVLKALAEEAGCRVIFLPAYSPDFNSIEKVWANMKEYIKNFMRDFSSLNECVNHYFQLA